MTDSYTPPEHQIQNLIKRTDGDPRRLAIAYLRAQKRARDAEAAFDVLNSMTDAMIGVTQGDGVGAMSAVRKARRRMAQHKDISDTGGSRSPPTGQHTTPPPGKG